MPHDTSSIFLTASWVALVFPFASFVINGLWLGRRHQDGAGIFSVLMAAASLVWTLGMANAYRLVVASAGHAPALTPWSFRWLTFEGGLAIRMGGLIDPISVMMLSVVAVIALVVQVYSIGYMRQDPSRGRFFALLSLFTFAMMGLVQAADLLHMYIFWELVGVSSYLLIGFWYHKPEAVAAAKKAFIVTRFADAFFLLGIIVAGSIVRDFSFLTLNHPHAAVALNQSISLGLFSVNALGASAVLIFVGGWGKSAMFPLHVWLPDAMEGPTLVSSIIHSATMVVAGVFLTARLFPLFAAAGAVLPLIMVVGAFTALFAAVIACTQMDIKRILAFSTLSQIGYMMFALGVTQPAAGAIEPLGYTASMFHVFTHAFFKCLLFLGAGVVIHAVHGNNLAKMGGLRKTLPVTFAATLVACLAIAGVFPFSGFFSKDEILLAALASGRRVPLAVGIVTGALTAFYMFRYFFLIFGGTPRGEHGHAHESATMAGPILFLALPSIAAGWFFKNTFMTYVVPPGAHAGHHAGSGEWVPWAASIAALVGITLAWMLYQRRPPGSRVFDTENRPGWYRVIQNKFYIDAAWLWLARRFMIGTVASACRTFDRRMVDGSMDGAAATLQGGGRLVRAAHNGLMMVYMGANILGVMILYLLLQGSF
jgi:NADH-quinone oxidoreductase subunit L